MDTTPAPMVVDSHPTQDVYKLDENDEMDKKVLAILPRFGVREWREDPSRSALRSVLQAVIAVDPKLDRKWISAYVDEIPQEVWTTVEEAWKTGSFKRVCILGNLQTPEGGENRTDPDRAALAEAMTDAYRGAYVDKFAQYLRERHSDFNKPGRTYYARFCSITQSSGTGKTRLLLELGKGLVVLYINIRSSRDKGYPPRDLIPADILTKPEGSEELYAHRCRMFFAAIFKCLADFCSQNSDHLGVLSSVSHEARAEFFNNVQAEFDKLKDNLKTREVMYEHYEQLQEYLKRQNRQNPNTPMVVIALDEAHVLHEENNDYLPAAVLFQTIKEYSEMYKDGSVWVVFASTAPKTSRLTSPQNPLPSARAIIGGKQLFTPFTALGWDQHAPLLNEIELDKVSLGSHLLRYGRPLWWSLKSGYSVRRIVDLAGQKLCASPSFNSSDNHQMLAVLGQRLGLDIAFGHRHAVEYNETLIASHLRFCFRTTEDQTWSYTAYPSEPIVSVAAAELLHMKKENIYDALGKVLRMVDDGLINTEDAGELASRFLWLLAKDLCVHKGLDKQISASTNSGDYKDEDLSYCRPVPVVEFLKLTFGPEILKAAPDAEEEFKDAFINFSHWIQMKSDITQGQGVENEVPIDEWTASLWARTCAVQCRPDQPMIDKVIPIYFKSRPREKAFSHILISHEASQSSQEGLVAEITRQHEHITPGYQGPPYIAILVNLGLSDSAINVHDDTGTNDPCLRIYAAALDIKTFPFLKQDIAEKLRELHGLLFLPLSRAYLEEAMDEARFGESRDRRYMNLKHALANEEDGVVPKKRKRITSD